MAIVTHDEVERVVDSCLSKALRSAESIIFNEERKSVIAKALMLGNLPEAARLKHSYGYTGRAVILSVDLRGSSRRALQIGARNTFITMHSLVPTMAFLVEKAGGIVVGLRGDGLFAMFGLVISPDRPKKSTMSASAIDAVNCGTAMIEVVDDYLNPALEDVDIRGGLRIGVGIAIGSIVVTRIGWKDAQEVTAYGPAINVACKFRGNNHIIVTHNVWDLLPKPDDGESGNIFGSDSEGGLELSFSSDAHSMIER